MTIEIRHPSIERWLERHEHETKETPEQFVRRVVLGMLCADAPWANASGPLSAHLFDVPSRKDVA